jgi:hypothetical protein
MALCINLNEVDGERKLPIVIEPAQSIKIALEKRNKTTTSINTRFV